MNQQTSKKEISYLALGDSYTIGESVKEAERWPNQLIDHLEKKGISVADKKIIAKTGWRTDDMLDAARNEVKQDKYDLVSLLIGVNNEYQGWEPKKFKPQFEKCLKYAIIHCKTGVNGVFVVSIPDYGYTPFGEKKQKTISKRLDEYNTICKEVCTRYKVPFYDITDISRNGLKDNSLVAKDGLHPSGKQYRLWVDNFADQVYELIMNQDFRN